MGTNDASEENEPSRLSTKMTKMMKKITIASPAPEVVESNAPSSSSSSSSSNNNSSSNSIGVSKHVAPSSSTIVPATTAAATGGGGGFWEYFINRKREHQQHQQQRQQQQHLGYHHHADPASRLVDTPTAMTLAAAASSSSSSVVGDVESSSSASSSLSSFSPSLSSWMNQAWQTVDSAKEWMILHTTTSDSSSPSNDVFGDIINNSDDDNNIHSTSHYNMQSNENTIWMTLTTISFPSFFSALNPFLDNHHGEGASSSSNSSSYALSSSSASSSSSKKITTSTTTTASSPSLFLPKFASRFEWATRQRNPYQAVIGREVYYAEYDWSNWLVLPHWLITNQQYHHNHNHHQYNGESSRIESRSSTRSSSRHSINNNNLTNHQQFVEYNIDGDGSITATEAFQKQQHSHGGKWWPSSRRNSRTSDASIQAVKDLLTLVQQQVAEMELEAQKMTMAQLEDGVESHSTILLHRQQKQEQPSTSSLLLQPMMPNVSTSSNSSSLTPTNPSASEASLPSPMTTPKNNDSHLFQDSFDSEDNLLTMRSSPVRATPRSSPVAAAAAAAAAATVDGFFSTETVVPSKSKTMDKQQAIKAEMAALLAEGTLRAYRDIALDEATELRSALHHWTIRWERPFLGWLEAGPMAWFQVVSEEGKGGGGHSSSPPPPPHLAAGKKVSQIQVVLARRCAVIGELQQHLWRASWQKGVAGWGMLGGGVGGEWTSVVGEFGGIDAPLSSSRAASFSTTSAQTQQQTRSKKQHLIKIFKHSNLIGTNVSNSPGGSRCIDDALTKWCIDAMRVIRDQLYRVLPASQGAKELPYVEHWPRERSHFRDEDCSNDDNDLPRWAKYASSTSANDAAEISQASIAAATAAGGSHESSVIIADLGKMAEEVSATLQSIEVLLEQQRARRLDWLRPPSRLRRNWYLVAVGVPVGAVMIYKLTKDHGWLFLLNTLFTKTMDICEDHVFGPLKSIYTELFTKSGRIDVTDRKARVDAIESLKRMLRSWLEESFPTMPKEEMKERADKMDISLIEEKMEESIKHLYELNSVVRMSLIEMQFIKKELLNALVQMDDLMGSNEINMRIAAMTPAVILLFAIRRAFQLLFYALFKMGKTKEEIHASFRQIILDIERLLLMRDCPPPPPDPLDWGSTKSATNNGTAAEFFVMKKEQSQTLSAEDLGMILLHIHECRNILWESRRRFRDDELRNVAEDLAELAGERGPVSVAQQLQIISRMSRTYPFMKVVSSGVPFPALRPGTG